MRILYLTDSLSDLDGVGRYAVRLITELEVQRPDMEVEVLLARKHRPTSADAKAHWKVSVGLPPDYYYHMPPLKAWLDGRRCLPGVRRAARRADIVHAIKDFPHSELALRAARAEGKPCIATGHGTYTVQPLLSPRYAARARKAYAGFDALIFVSNYTRRKVGEVLGGEAGLLARSLVIPNAVSTAHYAEPRSLGARPWHAHPFTLGIGELKERKGHHLGLTAWCRVAAAHPELHHYIVGNHVEDEYKRALLGEAARAGVSERVHLLGNITEDEKVDLLQRSRVFLHTPVTASDGGFEGFGIVYLEAAACGTPSLGTNDSGSEDAVRDGVSGLLVEQDVAAIERTLARLLGDDELRASLGRGGLAFAAEMSWTENARRVLETYDEVLRR